MQQKQINLSGSFLQNNKYQDKSERFVHITPKDVQEQLESQGFQLISLKTGHAKSQERQNHQTTYARYRHIEALSDDAGNLKYDIVAKIPHIYGAMEFMAGVYRLVCTNGIIAGNTYESHRISHTGNALELVAESVYSLVANKDKLLTLFSSWNTVQLSDEERFKLAAQALAIRAPDVTTVSEPELARLLSARRLVDASKDLWSTFNVLQENLTKSSFAYTRNNTITNQPELVKTRRLLRQDSAVNIDFNRQLFDVAASFYKVG